MIPFTKFFNIFEHSKHYFSQPRRGDIMVPNQDKYRTSAVGMTLWYKKEHIQPSLVEAKLLINKFSILWQTHTPS